MRKFDVITFGSATWDIFVSAEKRRVFKSKKFLTGRGVCFGLGSKADLEDINFSTGGGATNTAATFSSQGFAVAYCGAVGDDLAGQEIVERLNKLKINTDFVKIAAKAPTNHSLVINAGSDRTILVYKGASEELGRKDIPWGKLDAKWIYIAPLSGRQAGLTENIVNFARVNGISVALNPGNFQLKLKNIKRIISKVDVLILNKEEASILTGLDYKEEKKIFRAIDKMCPGIAIMTKGALGAVISDGVYLYKAGVLKTKVVDRTGAGDSFASGFVSGLLKNGDTVSAIELAMANSSACLSQRGAKEGLLKKNDQFKKVRISKRKL